MKRKKLLTALTVAVMLFSTGTFITESNAATVLAAKKTKKSSKKSNKAATALVQVKKRAAAYRPVLNKKGTAISKITPMKIKGKKVYLKGGKAQAIWSYKYKKVTYYYVKISKANVIVRAKDTKRLNKKKIVSLATFLKQNSKAASKKVNVPIKLMPFDKYFEASTNKTTAYWTTDKDGKPVKSSNTLPEKTSLRVLFQLSMSGKVNGQAINIPFYCAQTSKGQMIYLPAAYVTLSNSSAKIPDRAGYETNLKDWQTRAIKSIQDQIAAFEKKTKK